jgi:hypothetical protein
LNKKIKKYIAMKKIIIKITILACIMFLPIISSQLTAQPLPPFNHGQNGNQAEGAPLDGGISLLILLGAAYGGKKIHLLRKKADKKD